MAVKPSVNVKFKGSNTTKTIKNVSNLTYTDCATDESDTISISTFDTEFFNLSLSNNDKVECAINYKSKKLDCGAFLLDRYGIDGIPFAGRTTTNVTSTPAIRIDGIATPRNQDFQKSTRTKNWGYTTINNILCAIAEKYSLLPYYFVKYRVYVRDCEQTNQSDCDLLSSLCKKYGLALKVYNNKLIVYDEADYEQKDAVCVITPYDVINNDFSANIELTRQYTGYKGSWKSGDGVTHSYEKYFITTPHITRDIGTAYDFDELRLIGAAAVNEANKNLQVINLSVNGNTDLCSANCVTLTGFRMINGKYYINKATHIVDAQSGYITQLELRKIQQRLD